jgi:hypothetical protein
MPRLVFGTTALGHQRDPQWTDVAEQMVFGKVRFHGERGARRGTVRQACLVNRMPQVDQSLKSALLATQTPPEAVALAVLTGELVLGPENGLIFVNWI